MDPPGDLEEPDIVLGRQQPMANEKVDQNPFGDMCVSNCGFRELGEVEEGHSQGTVRFELSIDEFLNDSLKSHELETLDFSIGRVRRRFDRAVTRQLELVDVLNLGLEPPERLTVHVRDDSGLSQQGRNDSRRERSLFRKLAQDRLAR